MPMSRLSFSSISSTDSRLGGGALARAEAEEALPAEALEEVVLDDDAAYDALAVLSFLRALPEEEDDVVRVSVPNGSVDAFVVVASGALSSRKSTSSSPSASSSSHSVRGRPGSGRFFSNASNSFSMSDQKSEKP